MSELLTASLGFDTRPKANVEAAKLAALRDYLLPRLLSGRVRVGDGGLTMPERNPE